MSLRARPVVSIVIPAYNAAAFLGEQLEALADQDVDFPFEVLVCDNGSNDDTASIVRAFVNRMPNLRLVDASSRRGASAARNIGAGAATASLLLFCDADDVVGAGWTRALHDALADAPFVAGIVEHKLLNPGREWDYGWDRPTFHDPALPQLPACGSNNMGVRADVFAAVDGFDESLFAGEDLDFSWRVQLAGNRLVDAPSAVVHYRKRAGILAAIRQARAKGAGTRVLTHRYALVRAAYARQVAPQVAAPVAVPAKGAHRLAGALDRLGRLPRKALEVLRNPVSITPYLAALAFRWGYRRENVDGVAQLPVPRRLPTA
ncbi:Glycosyl transferase family 2 (modular protein) [Microbacterium sp. C448]|uniref:glycosyltransferase n=1 Tax=Microbacterium sp. C448 TaxID=1177594 RepID=UPI0003DE5FAB|nr:glycosyltransferase [Microbacterium sp. C448]CDK01852.1 Glycosyl transferase family 2 (modular protein) [Microbacterium sp. C448]